VVLRQALARIAATVVVTLSRALTFRSTRFQWLINMFNWSYWVAVLADIRLHLQQQIMA
jgi:hypothetical protein